MYRLVFCDLDGTIATYEHRIRPAVRQATQAVVDAGARITICTGRGYQTTKPFLEHLAINAPLVCCNGSLVVEPATEQVLHVRPMPMALALDLLRFAPVGDVEAWFYLDDLRTMLAYQVAERRYVLRHVSGEDEVLQNPEAALPRPPHKVVIFSASPQETPAVVERVQQHVGSQARVLASGPRTVEVLTPGTSKADALSFVAEHLGVPRQETMAIGDGNNDVEMLAWAGLGVAMGNATPEVKAAADWIAPSVDEDGAAAALQRFILQA